MISNVTKRIIKNTGFLILPQFANLGLQLTFTVLIARCLGSSNFGMFYFSLALVQLFHSFSELGIWTVIIRDVARATDKLSKYVNNALALRTCMVMVTYGLIAVAISFTRYSTDVKRAVLILGIGAGISSLMRVYVAAFRAVENMKYEGFGVVLLNIVYTGLGAAVVLNGGGLVGLALAHLIGDLSHAVFVLVAYRKVLGCPVLCFEADFSFWKYLFINGLPLGISKVLTFAESKIDIVLITLLRTPVEVGWYSAARRLCDMLRVFPTAFYGSLLPLWSNYHRSDVTSLRKLSIRTYKFVLFLILPVAMVVVVIPDRIISLMYGAEYLGAHNALRILIWLVVVSYVGTAFGSLLISSDNSRAFTLCIAAQLACTLGFGFLMIPMYGAAGIAAAVVASHTVSNLLCYLVVHKRLFSLGIVRNAVSAVLASAVMGTMLVLIRDRNLAVVLCIGALSYLLSFCLLSDVRRLAYVLVWGAAK